MEYIYRLNLPPLTDILSDNGLSIISSDPKRSVYQVMPAEQLLKPEWLTFNDCIWNTVLYFFKPTNFVGQIHTDTTNPDRKPWGINLIYGGSGVMSYYDPNKIPAPEKFVNDCGYLVHKYSELGGVEYPPEKEYILEPGAYLVNATLPHLPSSLGERHCFSLRSVTSYNLNWSDVIDKFNDYIVY